jgi:hypothetical protein
MDEISRRRQLDRTAVGILVGIAVVVLLANSRDCRVLFDTPVKVATSLALATLGLNLLAGIDTVRQRVGSTLLWVAPTLSAIAGVVVLWYQIIRS